jgi:hypothetical protein
VVASLLLSVLGVLVTPLPNTFFACGRDIEWNGIRVAMTNSLLTGHARSGCPFATGKSRRIGFPNNLHHGGKADGRRGLMAASLKEEEKPPAREEVKQGFSVRRQQRV